MVAPAEEDWTTRESEKGTFVLSSKSDGDGSNSTYNSIIHLSWCLICLPYKSKSNVIYSNIFKINVRKKGEKRKTSARPNIIAKPIQRFERNHNIPETGVNRTGSLLFNSLKRNVRSLRVTRGEWAISGFLKNQRLLDRKWFVRAMFLVALGSESRGRHIGSSPRLRTR